MEENMINQYDENIKYYTDKLKNLRVIWALLDDTNTLLADPILKKININLQPTVCEKDLLTTFSILSFTGIIRMEISIIAKHLLQSTQKCEKIFFIQRLFLIIHETFHTYKSFGEIINRYKKNALSSLTEKADSIKKSRKEIYKYITEKELTQIRNNSVHFSLDFTVYYDTLLLIAKNQDIDVIIKEFISFCDQLLELSHKIGEIITSEILSKNSSIDSEKMNKVNELLKLWGDPQLRKSIREKIEKDYPSTEVDGIEKQILMTYILINNGTAQKDALKITSLSLKKYTKYKPE